MKICIFTNPIRDNSEIHNYVESLALQVGFEIDNENPDIVFACGGDGTLLRAVHAFIDKLDKVKFTGVNFGNLGFFYDFEKEEIGTALNNAFLGNMNESSHYLLKGKITDNNGSVNEIYAINEVRIENSIKPLMADVYIDNERFESFLGTGLTVSTSIGSTAYNLTLGGAAVSGDFESLQLTPVQPSTQSKCFKSSLVMSPKRTIKVTGFLNNVLLGYDFVVQEKQSFKQIELTMSDKSFVLLGKSNINCFKKLSKIFN